MNKDTCYLTDEEMEIRNEIIEEKNKAYIEGFGYASPSKTKTIIVDSDGDINKMVGSMEQDIETEKSLPTKSGGDFALQPFVQFQSTRTSFVRFLFDCTDSGCNMHKYYRDFNDLPPFLEKSYTDEIGMIYDDDYEEVMVG